MFHNVSRTRPLVALFAIVALLGFAGAGYAGHGPLPNHDPACTATPNPATVGAMFTLSAAALPTIDPVWLITQGPDGSSTVSPAYVNSDGSWSGHEIANQGGTWTYTFSGLMNNKKYGAVEACSVQVN